MITDNTERTQVRWRSWLRWVVAIPVAVGVGLILPWFKFVVVVVVVWLLIREAKLRGTMNWKHFAAGVASGMLILGPLLAFAFMWLVVNL